ncbi:abortive infection family protein [Rhodococcus globerulus]|uniref:abortive infection family protein n=1 Tax=Rhodococcus globerulus TaxID=33008 RepID=UPI000B210DA9
MSLFRVDLALANPRFEVLSGSDENFLKFVAHTVHARVRPDVQRIKALARELNELLTPSYELIETTGRGGSTVYTFRDGLGSFHHPRPVALAVDRAELGTPETLHQHLKRIEGSIATDPQAAIGSCKELVESVMAQILDARGEAVGSSDTLPKMFKNVIRSLGLETGAVADDPRASAAVAAVVRGLTATVQSVGELRNSAGTGHGRASTPAVTQLHARLVQHRRCSHRVPVRRVGRIQ